MQIIFDPKNPDDCLSVMALLSALGGGVPAASSADDGDDSSTPSVAAGTVDSRGVPFLPEFHSGSTNKDGSWRYRRNTDRAKAEAAEMAARGANPIATPAAAVASVPTLPTTAPAVPAAPAPVVATPSLALPTLPAPAPVVTYERFIEFATNAIGKHAMSAETWANILVACGAVDGNGVADNTALQTNESARAAVMAHLSENYA